MSLYTIRDEYNETLSQYLSTFDSDSGEILDEENFIKLREDLKALENTANEGMENTLKYRQNIEAEIISIDSEIERLSARKKSLTKKSDSLTNFIGFIFRSLYEGKTMNFGMFSIGYRKSSAVNVLDASLIPSEYMRQPPLPPPAPDKTAIKDAIKEGKEVPGAEIEEREALFIK